MVKRFHCPCGMAFSVEEVRPDEPVVCPVCGTPVEEGAGIGTEGPITPLEIPPVEEMGRPTLRCPVCQALNSAEDAVCGLCGARLDLEAVLLAGTVEPSPPAGERTFLPPGEADPTGAAVETTLLTTEERRRQPVRYEGELRTSMWRLILGMLLSPRRELETLVSFLSYRDMMWKLMGLFLVGVVGLWLTGWQFSERPLPMVSGFTFGARMPLRASWVVWLGMAFSAAAFITAGLTGLGAVAGLLTGHGWHFSALALAFIFVVSLVNAAHLLLLPISLLGETAVVVLAWVLLGWEVLLTVLVINKVLDCDAVLSLILAAVICAATVQFYNRIYRLTEQLLPGQERVHMQYRGR